MDPISLSFQNSIHQSNSQSQQHSETTHHFRLPAIPSHPSLDLLGPTDSVVFQQQPRLHPGVAPVPAEQSSFTHNHHPRQDDFDDGHTPARAQHPLPPPPRHSTTPTNSHGYLDIVSQNGTLQSITIPRLRPEEKPFAPPPPRLLSSTPAPTEPRPLGQLVSRIVANPPDLLAWREKLFNVDDIIILSNDQFETYFPHIDNVYSHRSTQRYKRKPFISHYWDCRMKGRPPGTAKSEDPTKKKRKRRARERDLCDVKIKITEYLPGAMMQTDGQASSTERPTADLLSLSKDTVADDQLAPANAPPNGDKFWTIQRVNGNGGNGKGDGVAGPHKHSLEMSDSIKKSTVHRFLQAQVKETKKPQKPLQKRPSGLAFLTAKKHSKDHELKLYAASSCPFSQRVWIALEAKGMQYQYCETDPFKRPTHLLEANPRGLVPAIREGEWASGESTVILEYLEDRDQNVPLLPTDPRLKANCRFWIDHINAKIVPSFYALAKATELAKQSECMDKLSSDIAALVQAADERGPYFLGGDLCLVDVHFAPFVLRMSFVLRDLCDWRDPIPGTRWQQWAEALEQNPHIQATTSAKVLYTETMEVFLRGRQPPVEIINRI